MLDGERVVLRARNLTKHFGTGVTRVTAVHDVHFDVTRGEIVLIMGPSGSGKTTLLSLLGALLRPSAGRIDVNGVRITDVPEARLPRVRLHAFGFIFQDFNLLAALTALENVAFVARLAGVPHQAANERAHALLRSLHVEARAQHRPAELSGGEKQRVAIARAFVNAPSVILADEPTANLDGRAGRDVLRALRSLAAEEKRAVVIVSHDERVRDVADRVVWMEDGTLRAP